MRLDKFLKMSRVIKRRTIANEVADNRKSLCEWKDSKTKLWSKSRRHCPNSIRRQNINLQNN